MKFNIFLFVLCINTLAICQNFDCSKIKTDYLVEIGVSSTKVLNTAFFEFISSNNFYNKMKSKSYGGDIGINTFSLGGSYSGNSYQDYSNHLQGNRTFFSSSTFIDEFVLRLKKHDPEALKVLSECIKLNSSNKGFSYDYQVLVNGKSIKFTFWWEPIGNIYPVKIQDFRVSGARPSGSEYIGQPLNRNKRSIILYSDGSQRVKLSIGFKSDLGYSDYFEEYLSFVDPEIEKITSFVEGKSWVRCDDHGYYQIITSDNSLAEISSTVWKTDSYGATNLKDTHTKGIWKVTDEGIVMSFSSNALANDLHCQVRGGGSILDCGKLKFHDYRDGRIYSNDIIDIENGEYDEIAFNNNYLWVIKIVNNSGGYLRSGDKVMFESFDDRGMYLSYEPYGSFQLARRNAQGYYAVFRVKKYEGSGEITEDDEIYLIPSTGNGYLFGLDRSNGNVKIRGGKLNNDSELWLLNSYMCEPEIIDDLSRN